MNTQSRSFPHWPQFRGPRASGVAEGFPTPTRWDVEKKDNLLFKTPLPGLGHASPIVWGNQVFVATAVAAKKAPLKVGLYGDIAPADDDGTQEWRVHCVDKRTGKLLWSQLAHKGAPQVRRHPKGSHASSTLATDGKRVVAFFGSEGLFCFDLKGKLLWKRSFGLLDSGYYQSPTAQWGFASSPVLFEDKVVVQADVQRDGFVAALDAATGKVLWRTPRTDVPTWSTPTVHREDGTAQVIVNGWRQIASYDLATGKELWSLEGGGDIPVPTPIVANGLIFITNAHGRQAPIYAIRTSARGKLALPSENQGSPDIAWYTLRDGAYMQTPLVYGEHLYVCRDNGVLGCYELETGKRLYQERLGTGRTGFTASLVAADNKLYATSEEGDIFVLAAGPSFKVLSQNPMGEICMATPALSEGRLYFHTQEHLVGIGPRG